MSEKICGSENRLIKTRPITILLFDCWLANSAACLTDNANAPVVMSQIFNFIHFCFHSFHFDLFVKIYHAEFVFNSGIYVNSFKTNACKPLLKHLGAANKQQMVALQLPLITQTTHKQIRDDKWQWQPVTIEFEDIASWQPQIFSIPSFRNFILYLLCNVNEMNCNVFSNRKFSFILVSRVKITFG